MTTTATTAPKSAAPKLFQKPIPIIGVTGEFESGKTRFLLSIAPGPYTCIFDTEGSSATYADDIGFRRIDLPALIRDQFPNGYNPIDMFNFWLGLVRSIPAGKFRVIGIDVVEDIETGLADWVWEHPLNFNHTKQQYMKMSGIYWGDVKNFWKSILVDIQARCETFAFAVHMGSVWGSDNKPLAGQKRPKGKSTLMELATLFLQLERPTLPDGSRQSVPSARRLKSRLSHNVVRDGQLFTQEILPPRIPQATPEAIRAYMAKPFDPAKLSDAEKAAPVTMSEDERAAIKLATAQAEAEVARTRLEEMQEKRRAQPGQPVHVEPEHVEQTSPPAESPEAPGESLQDTMAREYLESPTKQPAAEKLFEQTAAIATASTPEPSPTLAERIIGVLSSNGNSMTIEGILNATGAKMPAVSKAVRDLGEVGRVNIEKGIVTLRSPTQSGSPATSPTTPPVNGTPNISERPTCLATDRASSVMALFAEFSFLHGWSQDEQQAAWKTGILGRYNVTTIKALTEPQLNEIEQNLARKVHEKYVAEGRPEASPFRPAAQLAG